MQKPTNLLQAKQSLQILLSASVLIIVAGLLWYAVTMPAEANNPPSSAYDGISPAGPVMNSSPVPCTGGEEVLLIQDNVPWFAPINQDPLGANVTELKAQNKKFCIINSGEIGTTNLNQFPEIIISAAQIQAFYNNLFPGVVVHSALVSYVQRGGVLTANLTDNASGPGAGGNWDGKTFIGGLTRTNDFSQNNDIALSSHPVITGQFGGTNGGQIVDTASFQDLDNWNFASHGFFVNLPPNTRTILRDVFNRPVLIEYPFGNGIVIASQITNEWRYAGDFGTLPQNKKLLANEIGYQSSFSRMINPTVSGIVKRGFGICFNPTTGKAHEGVDIDSNINGAPVFAAASGRVVIADRTPEGSKAGIWIWIFHGDIVRPDGGITQQISTRYLHLASISPGINDGSVIARGDVIGFVDNTGIGSTASHLHFEVRKGIPIPSDFRLTTALNPEGFVTYPFSPAAFSVTACSPVDLIITDPDGLIVSKDINELPSLAEYFEVKYQIGLDEGQGTDYDQITIEKRKIGDYLLSVIPEPGSLLTDVYSLLVTFATTSTAVVENIKISDIPDQPYILRSTETEIEKIIPAKVRITPRTLNLSNEGVFSALIEFSKGFGVSVSEVDPQTITVQGAPAGKTIVAANKFLVATFRTQDLENIQSGEKIALKVAGRFKNGVAFEGSDTIRVIHNGKISGLSLLLASLYEALSQLLKLLQKL